MSQRITAISCLTVAWLPHSLSPCPSPCYLCCRLPADMRLSLRAECPCCSRHRHTHTQRYLRPQSEQIKTNHSKCDTSSEECRAKTSKMCGWEWRWGWRIRSNSPAQKWNTGVLESTAPYRKNLLNVDCRMKKLSCILTPTKQKNVCFGMVDANHIVN